LSRIGRAVSFAGKIGADAWGRYCTEALRAEGVDVSHVMCDPLLKTGVTVVLTSARDRALVTHPGATEALSPSDLPENLFTGRKHLHVSSFFLQTGMRTGWFSIMSRARAAGWSVSLDPGFDPLQAWDGLRDLLPLIDVLLPNEVELAALGGKSEPEHALRALARDHNAGFLDAWLDRHGLCECLRAGVACGALSTRGFGGIAAQPTRDELRRTLQAGW
jgi:sugar/nucleoside kinase (ribokinase family)